MPDKPISPLRQRMIDEMTARSGRAAPQASGGAAARAKGLGRFVSDREPGQSDRFRGRLPAELDGARPRAGSAHADRE